MGRVRHILLSLLAVLGLLTALGWTGVALACPSNSVVSAPAMHDDGCGHASTPAKPRSANHDGQICASLCFGVLPQLPEVKAHPALAYAPPHSRFQPLSGIDPGLDPPPPRAA